MSFCLICFLRRSHCSQLAANPTQWHPSPSDLTAELEVSRRFSLAALTALLAVLAILGSKTLQPAVVLTLLIYIITLHLALNTCFLLDYPTMSRLLHVVPLLGISCMACIELIFGMRSPALATICIFLGILPLVTMVIHHGRQCTEMSTAALPVQMVHVLAPAVSDPADHMRASNLAEGTSETFSSNPC